MKATYAEMKADINADAKARHEEAEARQEKADADAKARHEEAEAQQQRAEARQEKMNTEMKASQERASAEMKVVQAEIKAAYAEMEARAEARHERFLARLDGLISYGEGTTTCQTETTSSSEEMEATNLKATPEETEAPVERQDLVKEEINAENIGSSDDRSGYQRLAVRRRRGAKKRSQDSVGSRQKLSAARKRVIRRAIPGVSKGNIRKGPGNDSIARRAPKGRRLVKIRRRGLECNNGIWNRGSKNQLHLRMRRTSSRNYRMPMQLEEENRIVSSTIKLQDVNDWTFWKVQPPPKRKKELRTE
jgi:hypothetical protein